MKNYTVQTKINKSIQEVFEAVIDNKKLGSYFVQQSSGPLKEGTTVIWHWTEYGDKPVKTKQIIANKKIVFVWGEDGPKQKQVTMNFEQIDERKSMISISETGWDDSNESLQESYEHVSGWEFMSAGLKVFLEHGIDIRK